MTNVLKKQKKDFDNVVTTVIWYNIKFDLSIIKFNNFDNLKSSSV